MNALSSSDFTEVDAPFALFHAWFAEAAEKEINDPDAVTLATVDASGLPDARAMLCKQVDERGFVFYTNGQSAKGAEIGEKLLRLHLRATELIKAHPEQAAPFILKALGAGILTEAQIDRALAGSSASFVADPARIVDSVARLQDFEVKLGTVKAATPVADLIDLDFYNRVAK